MKLNVAQVKEKATWLASYPRSGNTFLRTILYNCFGIKTASFYADDLGGNKTLENFVGHIEHNQDQTITFEKGSIPIVKTHFLNKDNNRAIYIVRDGRAASVSLYHFFGKQISLKDIIIGNQPFGAWKDHILSWDPQTRSNTLLIKYEDLTSNFQNVLVSISDFLRVKIINYKLPSRDKVAHSDGKWVRSKTNWRDEISNNDLKLFEKINFSVLNDLGYKLFT